MLFGYELPTTKALVLCLFTILPLTTTALFTSGFQSYLAKQYGAAVSTQLTRADLGSNASFGGNPIDSQIRIFRDPVVLVHGINANATSLIPVRDFFKNLNYGIGEVYATSYGPSSKNVDYSSTLECSYIKQIRQLIVAVNAYTIGKRVSVIAYSTGVPHARKAILGGDCVDTKENLGSPLTKQVNVFLSVAGANLGAAECTNFPSAAICGNTAGLKSTSAFFKDINSKSGYEGSSRFSIVSKTDDIVGFENSPLPGSQINVTMDNFNHGDTLFNTLNIQASLIANGFVPQRMIDKDAYAQSKISGQNCSGTVSEQGAFMLGPHVSQQALRGSSGGEFGGEYIRASNSYKFPNGVIYTKHNELPKGKSFGSTSG